MRADWKAYFTFSKKDRVGAIVILSLIVLIFFFVFFYHPANIHPVAITTLDQELAKQGIDTASTTDEQIAYLPTEESEIPKNNTGELFQFDPNTLDAAGFKRLGLPDKTINIILNYRSKGGHFWKADDLRKIYSLRKADADRLIPYIQIAAQQQSFTKASNTTSYTKPKPGIIDINTATAVQWKALPALGDALANRIVKFRDKMGSFTSVAQVKQTYGLSDSAYQAIEPYLTITSAQQKTVAAENINKTSLTTNINTASLTQLKNNSHIPESVAQAIVIYRSQHGSYSSIEDVKKIVFINDELYQQISPYISVE